MVCLYKLVHKYLERKKPEFVNVDEERLHELTQVAESAKGRVGQGGEEEEEEVLQQGIVMPLLAIFIIFVIIYFRGVPGVD